MNLKFNLQLFGSKTTVHNEPAKIPEPTPEERELQRKQLEYVNRVQPMALDMANKGWDSTKGIVNVDYNKLYGDATSHMAKVAQGYIDLTNGKVNPEYQKHREIALKHGTDNTFGEYLNNLTSRGVVNSSTLDKANDALQKNITAEMSRGFRDDINQSSNLLAQQEESAWSPLRLATSAQQASLAVPQAYWAMASGQNAPTNDAWKTMYNNRMSIATPAQSYVSQDPGFFGGLMGGVGSYYGAKR